MSRVWIALVASVVSSSAFAQSAVLYQPARGVKDQGINIKSWGSGTISETDETAYEGTHSIRVSTRNYFQGGLINFSTPIDLSKDFLSKSNLLKLTFKVADSGVVGGGSGKGGGLGGPGIGGGLAGAGGGGKSGGGLAGAGGPGKGQGLGGPGRGAGGGGGKNGGIGGPPGGFGGPGGPGGFGGPGGGQRGKGPGAGGPGGLGIGGPGGMGGGGAVAPVLKQLRLIITTTDGKKSEVYVPANTSGPAEDGWTTVAIPLQAVAGLDRTNKTISQIGIAGNTTATFYVGALKIVDDTTPIRGDINTSDLNIALGDEYTLTASGYGGSSILKYTWDFDDKDGIQVDADGQSVNHKFRKPGTYKITVTISDYYGLKQPYTKSIKAVVNP